MGNNKNYRHNEKIKNGNSTKKNVAKTSGIKTTDTKSTESFKSQFFIIKRVLVRTLTAINKISMADGQKSLMDVISNFDETENGNCQSSQIDKIFSQIDNEMASHIQPPKPVNQVSIENTIPIDQHIQQVEANKTLKDKYEQLCAEMMALKSKSEDSAENDLLSNDLLSMSEDDN